MAAVARAATAVPERLVGPMADRTASLPETAVPRVAAASADSGDLVPGGQCLLEELTTDPAGRAEKGESHAEIGSGRATLGSIPKAAR
jgi:hypothetical protein